MTPSSPSPSVPPPSLSSSRDLTPPRFLQTKIPTGLVNLQNTCYLNSTVQALRAIPELDSALAALPASSSAPGSTTSSGNAPLTRSMKQMWDGMGKTTEGYAPYAFLSVRPFPSLILVPLHKQLTSMVLVVLQALRSVAPQFAEQGRGGGYAQQDADECWTVMTNALHALPPSGPSSSSSSSANFVSQFMMGEMVKEYAAPLPRSPSASLAGRAR